MACVSMGTWSCYSSRASASLSLHTGSKIRTSVSFAVAPAKAPLRSGLLHCSFVSSSSSSLSFSSKSSFSGSPLGLNLDSNLGEKSGKRRSLVVRAKKYRLCQTKRNRSRKSLARTHGFRKRMSTTSGRATIKRRRAKGRWDLCPKTNPSSGKRA